MRFLHERLLYRLAQSRFSENFCLKGGMLFYAMEGLTARPTKDDPVVNYYLLAKKWIRLIQPYLLEAKKKVSRRHTLVHLGSMLKIFKKEPLPTSIFEKLNQGLTRMDPVEKRIAAYIIGVKKKITPPLSFPPQTPAHKNVQK